MPRIIYRNKAEGLTVEAQSAPSPEWIRFLEKRVWGGQGARFCLSGIGEKYRRQKNAVYFSLKKDGELIGSYCFQRRQTLTDGRSQSTCYRSGLAVSDAFEGNGYGKLLVQAAKKYFERRPEAPLSYGFIDSRNTRSLEALRAAGYEGIGSFEPVIFSRILPREKTSVSLMTSEERRSWMRTLRRAYRGYACAHFDDAPGEYFGIRRGGRMVAGLRARAVTISLQSLGGPLRDLVLRWLPRRSVRFATFEAVSCDEGGEADLTALMETLLQKLGVYCAVLFLDPKGPLYRKLKAVGLGWLDLFYPKDAIEVMVAGKKAQRRRLARRPFYVSAADVL